MQGGPGDRGTRRPCRPERVPASLDRRGPRVRGARPPACPGRIKWVPKVQLQRFGIRFQTPVPFDRLFPDVRWKRVEDPPEGSSSLLERILHLRNRALTNRRLLPPTTRKPRKTGRGQPFEEKRAANSITSTLPKRPPSRPASPVVVQTNPNGGNGKSRTGRIHDPSTSHFSA